MNLKCVTICVLTQIVHGYLSQLQHLQTSSIQIGRISLERMPSASSIKGKYSAIYANMNDDDNHGKNFHDLGLNSTQSGTNNGIIGGNNNAKMFLDEECYDLCEVEEEDVALQPEESSDEHKSSHSVKKISSRRPSASSFNRYQHRKQIRMSSNVIEEQTKSDTARAREGLNLHWNIKSASDECDVQEDMLSCSEPCTQCRGKGVVECQFCHGVGFVDFGQQEEGTVGGRMVRENGGFTGIHCPVCNEDGEQECFKCNGNGWIAKWKLKDDNSGDILLP